MLMVESNSEPVNTTIPETNPLEPPAQFSVPPLPHQEEVIFVSPSTGTSVDSSSDNVIINLLDGVDRISRASHSVKNASVPVAEATSNIFSGGILSLICDLGSMLPSTGSVIVTSVTLFSQTLTLYRQNEETINYLWDLYKPRQQSYFEKAYKLYCLFKKC